MAKKTNQSSRAPNTARRIKEATQAPKMAFRFLDLPAELRNRVYDFVAADATITIINRKKARKEVPKPHSGPFMDKHKAILRDVKKLPKRRSIIGLLRTCRQIQNEVKTIIESAISLDLRFAMLASSRVSLKLLRGQWADKLALIRHLEVDNTDMWFSFILGRCSPDAIDYWTGNWKSYYGSESNVDQLLRLRAALLNVDSITVHAMEHSRFYKTDLVKGGARIAFHLVEKDQRVKQEKVFPKLVDIKCIGKYGGERFKKVDGNWQLYYSGQRLPLSLRTTWRDNDIDSRKLMSRLGLMTAESLSWLGTIPT